MSPVQQANKSPTTDGDIRHKRWVTRKTHIPLKIKGRTDKSGKIPSAEGPGPGKPSINGQPAQSHHKRRRSCLFSALTKRRKSILTWRGHNPAIFLHYFPVWRLLAWTQQSPLLLRDAHSHLL